MAKRYNLTDAERETVINFDREGDMASLYTADRTVMTKLDKLCKQAQENYKLVREDAGFSKTYEFPKDLITFRSRKRKLDLTDEQRIELQQRGRAIRKNSQ
ncbi:hypothetical protein [Eubacterium aggregans]|uniref:hypothetical protein n=1 Tax=Eubacterium aggregans TaxID=81409 RepID=UPI003F315B0C